jgi:hypothetical protein
MRGRLLIGVSGVGRLGYGLHVHLVRGGKIF